MPGVYRFFQVSVASGATLSSELDVGRSYERVWVRVPTMNSNSQLHLQVAGAASGTYARVRHEGGDNQFNASMASAGTLTPAVNLGRTYQNLWLRVPTMNSNVQLHIQAAASGSGTYSRVNHPVINSSSVSCNVFAIASSVTNTFVPIPSGFQYIKVEATAAVDNGCVFNIIASAEDTKDAEFTIQSWVTNAFVPLPEGFRYLKIESTATIDNGATFDVICAE